MSTTECAQGPVVRSNGKCISCGPISGHPPVRSGHAHSQTRLSLASETYRMLPTRLVDWPNMNVRRCECAPCIATDHDSTRDLPSLRNNPWSLAFDANGLSTPTTLPPN